MSELAKDQENTKVQTAETVAVKKAEDITDRVQKLFDSIEKRAYELFKDNGETFGHDVDDWFKAESELLHPVQVELKEADGTITLRAEVPGFNAGDIDIGLKPWQLTLTGKNETKTEKKKGKTVYTEFSSDQFLRVLDLPAEADLSKKIEATLQNGVLKLTIPKAVSPQKISLVTKTA